MKKLFTLGNVIPLFVVVFFTSFFVSCGKNSGGATGGGPIEPNPTKPSISAADPVKGWYNGDVSGSFSVSGSADNLTVTASAADSGPLPVVLVGTTYTISNVVQRTTITITATNKYGSDTKVVYGDVWSQDLTNLRSVLCYTDASTDGIYRLSAIQVDNGTVQTTGLVCMPIRFFLNGDLKTYGGECTVGGGTSTTQWAFAGTEGITFSGQAYEKITHVSSKVFMVEFHNTLGQLSKRWFTKN